MFKTSTKSQVQKQKTTESHALESREFSRKENAQWNLISEQILRNPSNYIRKKEEVPIVRHLPQWFNSQTYMTQKHQYEHVNETWMISEKDSQKKE